MLKSFFKFQNIIIIAFFLLMFYGLYKFATQDNRMTMYYPDSEVVESRGDFNTLGKPVGIHSYYYENGNLFYEIEYEEGKRNGEYKKWSRNGQLILMCTYLDGKLDGEMKEWSKDGIIINHEVYKNGNFVKRVTYLKE